MSRLTHQFGGALIIIMLKRNSKGQFVKGSSPNHKGCKRPEITGKNNGRWKGGVTYRSGYKFIYSPNHPFKNGIGYVREHRLIMEKHIGRYLNPTEVVHHINKVRDDNRLENLELLSCSKEHRKFHPTRPAGWNHSEDTKQILRELRLGKSPSQATRDKISKSIKLLRANRFWSSRKS